MILCCGCGVSIQSNPANMCAQCLQSRIDITAGIPKQITIFWCRNCRRYQRPPWETIELESQKMLSLCLSKIKGLNKEVKLTDAAFIWTEPHSRRIKVKLTVQKDVFNGIIMQQVFVVEFIVGNMQCPDCERSFTEHTWKVCVQVRQNRKHKRTLYFLEQLLIRHNMCAGTTDIKEINNGLDFYWDKLSQANRLTSFLRSVLPVRLAKVGEKLISQDDNSNTKKYKFGMHVEIAEASKEDVILVNRQLVSAMGGVSPVLLVYRVSNTLHLIDPVSLKTFEINAQQYFHQRPRIMLTSEQLTEFIVVDVEVIGDESASLIGQSHLSAYTKGQSHAAAAAARNRVGNVHNAANNNNRFNSGLTGFNKQTSFNARIVLAEVTIARSDELGEDGAMIVCRTHLGAVLKPGDTVLGYDLARHNLTGDVLDSVRARELPDVILVRKTFPQRQKRAAKRMFKLKQLPKTAADSGATAKKRATAAAKEEEEYEEFMKTVEEDPEMRSKINLYRRYDTAEEEAKARARLGMGMSDDATATGNDDGDDDDGFPEVRMEELLDSLQQLAVSDEAARAEAEGEDDDEQLNWGDDGGMTAPQQVISGRGLKNKARNLPERSGGFANDEDPQF
jgi:nonsense-mediated mRNA decay protein 3